MLENKTRINAVYNNSKQKLSYARATDYKSQTT